MGLILHPVSPSDVCMLIASHAHNNSLNRIGKALLEGRETIAAVQFVTMPKPDEVIDDGV